MTTLTVNEAARALYNALRREGVEEYYIEQLEGTICDLLDEGEIGDGMTDAEADADVLASAGWGTDEDYGAYDY